MTCNNMSITKQKIEIPNTTLSFYKCKNHKGEMWIEYDARECTPPEPMVNTIYALQYISEGMKLKGKFFHEPFPLYERLGDKVLHTAQELEDGSFEIVFQKFRVD